MQALHEPQTLAEDGELLDAYSSTVTRVAAELLGSVASLQLRDGRRAGGGSAVIVTPDGFLLTSAHVVGPPWRSRDVLRWHRIRVRRRRRRPAVGPGSGAGRHRGPHAGPSG